MADIKSHPWFRGIDWQAVYNKEVVPPFEPDVSRLIPSYDLLNRSVKTGKLRCDS